MRYEVYMAIHKLASIKFDEGIYDTLQEALEFSREDIESLLEGTLSLDEVDENTLEVFLDIPNWSIESREELGTHWVSNLVSTPLVEQRSSSEVGISPIFRIALIMVSS